MSKSRAIHYTGIPCNIDKHTRWKSCWLTSNPDKRRVTCKKCLYYLNKGFSLAKDQNAGRRE